MELVFVSILEKQARSIDGMHCETRARGGEDAKGDRILELSK